MGASRPCIISTARSRSGQPDGGRRPERRRQVDPAQGHRRARLRPLAGHIALSSGPSPAHRLSAAGRRDRPVLPARRSTISSPWACGRRSGLFGGIGRADRARIEEALAAVGLTGFERRPIGTLSGGQMQRALFARLLLQDAALILLDEPFTAIDAKTTADLLDLVRRWHGGSAHRRRRAARSRPRAGASFPRRCSSPASRSPGATTAEVLSAENLLRARRMVEALRSARRGLRRRLTTRQGQGRARASDAPHALRPPHRSLRRIRVHAARAGRRGGARARRRRRSACS